MKRALPLLVLALLPCARVLAQVDVGRPTGGTPYDQHLGPVRQVFSRMPGREPSIDEVRSLLRTGRRFRYYYDPSNPYVPQLPEVTEARKEGDCKAKSLWMASKMGDRNTRFVIGKTEPGRRMSHAWLMWASDGTWLFLDPTNTSEIIYAERVVGRKLIPQYSYRGGSAYSHPNYSEIMK